MCDYTIDYVNGQYLGIVCDFSLGRIIGVFADTDERTVEAQCNLLCDTPVVQ
jgi:hypothetical protein